MTKVTYTYARTCPTVPYGNDRMEISLTEELPNEIPLGQFLFELRQSCVDEIDAAERQRRKELGS